MDPLERVSGTHALHLFRLDGRVALVTGAGGRFGKAISTALAQAGAHVILNGRTPSHLETLSLSLKKSGLSTSVAAFDITDEQAAEAAFQRIEEAHSRLDVLVNNAYSGATATFDTSSARDFARAYEVAVIAAFRLIQRAKGLLQKAATQIGHASVINISSMYGSVSPDPSIYGATAMNNPPFYGAAKAALLQLTRYAACHLAPFGIRVNALSPGPFPSPDLLRRFPAFERELEKKTPLGRVGDPAELMGAILFLASDASTYVTGATLPVDGGWTAW